MLKAANGLLRPVWRATHVPRRRYAFPTSFLDLIRNMPSTELQVTQLPNGLTIATEEHDCCNTCVGIYVDAGPLYESDFENGATHFFEHIAFKGTRARSKGMLEDQMACTGARFRCFTRRDMAAYYAEFLSQDLTLVVDLLSDCVFNNAFHTGEIEAQKNTVYYEMVEHDQDANKVLWDYLHAAAFQGTPLARTVMGPSCNLYNFDCTTLPLYMNRFYGADRTFLVGVGGLKHELLVSLGHSYMSKMEPSKCFDQATYRFTGSEIRYRNDSMPVATVAIAVEGPSPCSADYVAMQVAAEVVGGWDRSQPGGLDHGWYAARVASVDQCCDAYESFMITYRDTSLWGVRFVGTTFTLDDMMIILQDQWRHLCNTVTDVEIERAKKLLQLKLLAGAESRTRTCHDIARQLMYVGARAPLDERLCAVDRVFTSQVRAAMHKYVYDRCPAVAAVGPTEGLFDYVRIRAGMYSVLL